MCFVDGSSHGCSLQNSDNIQIYVAPDVSIHVVSGMAPVHVKISLLGNRAHDVQLVSQHG